MNNEKSTVDEINKTTVEVSTAEPENKPFDKRYDEPFENDGAYADDDIE